MRTKESEAARHKEYRQRKKAQIAAYKSTPKYKLRNSQWQKQNGKRIRKKDSEQLTDRYILSILKNKTGVKYNEIKKYPDYVEAYRQQIKLKRLIKTKKQKS